MLVVCAGCWSARADGGPIVRAELVEHTPNPRGLSVGFFANYHYSRDVLLAFGPRPIERGNFHKWYQGEVEPGRYDFAGTFDEDRRTHMAGATLVTNIDIFHTYRINPEGMNAMPGWVTPDIDDPETRAAAREFLKAYCRQLLSEVGAVRLVFDYELFWFAMPSTPEIRRSYRDWFVEACALAREVAADMGASDRLELGIIVNGDPDDMGEKLIGSPGGPRHVPQRWLLDCVDAADFVGIDTYSGGAKGTVSPSEQLRVIRFWIKNYAQDKPVYVTESGFSTLDEHNPGSKSYHIHGTEAQQAAFYADMFDALLEARDKPDDPLARVSAYCVWMFRDWSDRQGLEKYFGIVRDDGSPKPAFEVIKRAIDRIESDPATAPTLTTAPEDVSEAIHAGVPVDVRYDAGTRFSALSLTLDDSLVGGAITLTVETRDPACLMARFNGNAWQTTMPELARTHTLTIPELATTSVEIRLSSDSFPFETQITRVAVEPATPN